jgi:hypothetical protein
LSKMPDEANANTMSPHENDDAVPFAPATIPQSTPVASVEPSQTDGNETQKPYQYSDEAKSYHARYESVSLSHDPKTRQDN